MKMAVMDRSLRVETRQAIPLAQRLGFDGIQLRTSDGDIHPQALGPTGREELRHYLHRHGLLLSATCIDEGPLDDPATVDRRIAHAKRQIDLALFLGTNVVTGHIGPIPDDPASKAYSSLREAVAEVGRYASLYGIRYGTETGPDEPNRTRDFMQEIALPGVAVNYDPANLLMYGLDWLGGVSTLGAWIVHTHVKDAVSPTEFEDETERGTEAPFGQGDMDFEALVGGLRHTGYDGFLTVEREREGDPIPEITGSLRLLRDLTERF